MIATPIQEMCFCWLRVALSTTEAEYVALSTATQEAIWLRRLLEDIGKPLDEPYQGAIAMAKNPVGHARTKHIDIHYHFVREGVQDEAIILKYVATGEMIADILSVFSRNLSSN